MKIYIKEDKIVIGLSRYEEIDLNDVKKLKEDGYVRDKYLFIVGNGVNYIRTMKWYGHYIGNGGVIETESDGIYLGFDEIKCLGKIYSGDIQIKGGNVSEVRNVKDILEIVKEYKGWKVDESISS
jgi:hypothetical protein